MKRSTFLQQSSLFTLGSLLLPDVLFSGCRKESLFENEPYNGKIIIIGAGAAGLYAGFLLEKLGVNYQILEAADHVGGRMGKLSGFADYSIDTGAQWLHGKNNLLGDFILKNNIAITADETELSYWFNGAMVNTLPKDPFIFEEDNLPDVSFKEYAHQQGFGAEYDAIVEAIAGDQGASASLLSAYWNSKDEENWSSGDVDYKFSNTYFDVINDYFAAPIQSKISLNSPVASIDYSASTINVTTTNGTTYTADKVIVTVPISILKLGEIQFIPALSSEKTAAFSNFGMGPGMKVFLKFSQSFYPDNIYGGTTCAAYVNDTIGKSTNDHVMLAFVMGDQAQTLHNLGSDSAIVNALLQELDGMFNGAATANFIQATVFDYTAKPFIKGAYGYSTIGMNDARKVAAESLGNQVYFAGEAMNLNGHHQTVHGAVESAYQAIVKLYNEK